MHHNHVGFTNNRNMCDNLMNLISLIEYCDVKQIKALILSFDLEKAFDCVEWPILFKIMKEMTLEMVLLE